jgi:hypothetical protein
MVTMPTMWGSAFQAAAGFRPGAGRLESRLRAGLPAPRFVTVIGEPQ